MSDSTITVTFLTKVQPDAPVQKRVHVVVVKKQSDVKDINCNVIIIPVSLLLITASILVFALLKIKSSHKLNTFLDKIEKMFPRFLKF